MAPARTLPQVPAPAFRVGLRYLAGPVLRPGVPRQVQRLAADVGGITSSLPRGTRVRSEVVGGIPGEWVSAPGVARDLAVLHLHGGGFVLGSARSHRGLAAHLSSATGAPVFVPDYRRVPEHAHGAALDDADAAFGGLLELGYDAACLGLSGDSAGGGLALALAMLRRDAGQPLPAVVALICPWLDLGVDLAGTRRDNTRDPLLRASALRHWAALVARKADVASSAVSPGRGDLSGLPPMLLHAAGDDPLAVDGEALIRAAGAAGADLSVERFDGLWHDFHLQAGRLAGADLAIQSLGTAITTRLHRTARPLRVAIVGAGMSGLCMAHKLREAGHGDIVIFEKAGEVGGTWRENRYPGITCDVPSRFYSYSFAPNPDWTMGFSPGAEIQDYFVRTTDQLGLRKLIRFGEEVTEARWQDGRWRLRTATGSEDEADVLVTAAGILHHPKIPDIPGLQTFAGRVVHSARWDPSIDVERCRVGVIGTGSTGVQLTTALAGRARHLTLFQRTPQWVLPVPNRRYPASTRWVFRHIPPLNRLAHGFYQRLIEAIFAKAVVAPGWERSVVSALVRLNLRLAVRDPELRRQLTPDYVPLCKRLIMSAGFYPALQKDAVSLVTAAIDHVEPRGIVTADGRLHELDVLIAATGFDAHAYLRPMRVIGPAGRTLEDAWADGPRAYRTVALPGFPNLFTILGPHSPVGNQSIISVSEAQAQYIVQWVDRLQRGGVAHVTPREDATAAYVAELREAAKGTVFASGCVSWYLDADGVPEVWPWSPARHRAMLRRPELQDFDLEPQRVREGAVG